MVSPNLGEVKSNLEELQAELMDQAQVSLTAEGRMQPINPDRADLAQNYSSSERDLALQDKIEHTLGKIDQALQRIQEGTYGNCVRCSEKIADERLEALPYVDLCIKCQRIEEQQSV
jgi:DnaK suppressor protein